LRSHVGLDLALGGQRHVAVGVDLALHLAVDPQAPRRDNIALQACPDSDDRDLTAVRSHVRSLRSLGDLHALVAYRLRVLAFPDHRASTFWSDIGFEGAIACRIASPSSSERL